MTARIGDRPAFGALAAPHLPRLRSFLHRPIATPTTPRISRRTPWSRHSQARRLPRRLGVRDLAVHDRAPPRTDPPRTAKQRWPATIQLEMHDRAASSAELGAARGKMSHPEFRYEVAEHIAHCFSCIVRSLEPEDSAALILREILDLPDHDAARIVDLSGAAFRHRLGAARCTTTESFDGLCALINKQGACHPCSTLRGLYPPNHQGPPVEPLGDVAAGSTARMHAVMLHFIARHADPPTSSD
jgi:RNA polymerase sigma-70 factor, ECF subfamily